LPATSDDPAARDSRMIVFHCAGGGIVSTQSIKRPVNMTGRFIEETIEKINPIAGWMATPRKLAKSPMTPPSR
jgi:hypothetical protein